MKRITQLVLRFLIVPLPSSVFALNVMNLRLSSITVITVVLLSSDDRNVYWIRRDLRKTLGNGKDLSII